MKRRHAFTLVELLVVIGIIALLISILLPSLNRVREQAKETQCKSNMRQIWLACKMWSGEHKDYVPRGAKVNENRTYNPPDLAGFPPVGPSDMERTTAWLMDPSSPTIGGVVDFNNGCIWRYLSPAINVRRDMLMCPTDMVGLDRIRKDGMIHNIQRNFSYSLNARIADEVDNATVIAEIGKAASARLPISYTIKWAKVVKPSEKIMIFEELAPNDAYCTNPGGNSDDFPSGRHGQRTPGAIVHGQPELKGRANFAFFDGHIEPLPPTDILTTGVTGQTQQQRNRNIARVRPLTVRGPFE
jgi:prepilin-type N-terminal cleavage/methylation domain-containing protein/prepilin-type processing-associated H-X9-DG protein